MADIHKILLVEDDPFLLDMYATKFKEVGFNIAVAQDGEMGLVKAKEELPDLILLAIAAEQGASDLHIAPGRHPTLRIDGELIQLVQRPMVTPESSSGLCLALMD